MAEDDISDIEEICYQMEKLAEHYAEIEESIVEFDPESKIDMEKYNKLLERLTFLLSETDRRTAKVKKYCGYVTEDKLEAMQKQASKEPTKEVQASSSSSSTSTAPSTTSSSNSSSSSSGVTNKLAPPAIIAKAIAAKNAKK